MKEGERHHLCTACYKEYRHPSSSSTTSTSSIPSSTITTPVSLFSPPSPSHSHLSIEQRWTIILLHKQGVTIENILQQTSTSLPTIRHWINHYKNHHDVNDEPRSGCKRKTPSSIDETIINEARETKFTTPRRIKRKLGLDVSSRTIDRRLIEVGLYGRVAQHKKKFTEEEKTERLSFAEGYKHWTTNDWMKVMFADEKIFWGKGFWGRVFVRRPKGEALNPEYCIDQYPHPEKVNVWACFCGKGVGYCYIFNENMNSQLLQGILGTHLVESAELHFDVAHAEPWWFLQDNDPKHKSVLVRTWLFNHGIQCIDFPPYSPDLNPIENLWADLVKIQ
jgi:transposase